MAKASVYKPLAEGKSRYGKNMRSHKSGLKSPEAEGAIRLHQKMARTGKVEEDGACGIVTKKMFD